MNIPFVLFMAILTGNLMAAEDNVQTKRKQAAPVNVTSRDIVVTRRYLHLPIANIANKDEALKVTFLVEGTVIVKNDIGLADGKPDWWAFMDVNAWKGKTLTIRVDNLPANSMALKAIEQSDTLKDADDLYREALRDQFHFSSQRGWLNDPNGLSFFNGEYHLFYQHNPYGLQHPSDYWGHAVSRDLLHWQELGDTLAPDELGSQASGSAVVDWNNTSGFGTEGKPPHVLIYTAAGKPNVQCIAAGTDGRTYTKYSGNPVVQNITGGNRDPKVCWYEPTKKWVMVLYVGKDKKSTTHFLTSPNLRDWTLASVTEGGIDPDRFLYECPDFFELPVDGDVTKKKWVLSAASSVYAIGTFDGTTFTPEQTRLPGHRGRGFYAAQTFSDIPAQDGRRIQIGWLRTRPPGMPFTQSMSIPLELGLISTTDGPRLTMNPVKELATLRTSTKRFDAMQLKPDSANPLSGIKAELVELNAEFEPGDAAEVVFTIRGATIAYDMKKQELVVNQLRAPAPLHSGKQRLTVFCDRTVLEIFASDGLTYVPFLFQPKADDLELGVQSKGGSVKMNALQVHQLGSIWK